MINYFYFLNRIRVTNNDDDYLEILFKARFILRSDDNIQKFSCTCTKRMSQILNKLKLL